MGNPQTTFWQEITQGIGKFLIYLAYILMGVIAKLAFDSRSQRLTKKQIFIKTILSVFAGGMAATICENVGAQMWGKVIVPVATLIGEGFTGYVISNWTKIAIKWLPGWFPKDKTDK